MIFSKKELEDLADTVYRLKKVENVSEIKPFKYI